MKTIKTFIVVAALAFVANVNASELPTTRDVVVGVSDAFIPGGFDSSSESYAVASGMFPNGCYKWKQAEVSNLDANLHEIKSIASVSQGMCLMVLVPFTKEIKLGKLAVGKHTLRFLNGDGTYLEKYLVIEQ